MIDIEEIIGKRRYRVALPPEELFSRIDAYLRADTPIPDIAEWHLVDNEERYRYYLLNLEYSHIMLSITQLVIPDDSEAFELEVERLSKEFHKEDISDDRLKSLRGATPYCVYILIRKVDEFGCECEGICHSSLYGKLSKKIIDEEQIRNLQIQESRISSLQFLDQIFIGVLSGEVIEEVTDDFINKLLMNDSGTREITNIIDKLFNEATTEVLICGWIGTHYLPKLRDLKSKGVDVKFITHKPGEAKGQPWKSEVEEAYRSLCTDFGLDKISNARNIHGRTIVVDNKALIGTMDLNSSSLTGAHTEFAVFTNNPDIVRRMRAIFNTKFVPLSASE